MSNAQLLETLGLASGALYLVGNTPYLIDTLKGKTQPQRVTWGVLTALNCITIFNQIASGADSTLWTYLGLAAANGAIFVASLFKGVGGSSKLDTLIIYTAVLGVLIWWVSGQPIFSVVVNSVLGVISLIPTYIKAKRNPDSETKITWPIATFAALVSIFAVGELTFVLLLPTVTSFFQQLYLVYILYHEPALNRQKKPRALERV